MKVYLVNLDFDCLDIRSTHKLSERNAAINRFNDSQNSIQMLVISLRIISVFVNLQKNCHHVIFMNISINANTILQIIERVFRIDQKRHSKI